MLEISQQFIVHYQLSILLKPNLDFDTSEKWVCFKDGSHSAEVNENINLGDSQDHGYF